jgi:hypothetical protein
MQSTSTLTVRLAGRYYAAFSLIPYLLGLGFLLFCLVGFGVFLILQDPLTTFEIVALPLFLFFFFCGTLFVSFLLILRWHSKRYLEISQGGIRFVHLNQKEIQFPWSHLLSVEMRFARPRTVQCTLIFPQYRFSFTNLEINLEQVSWLGGMFHQGFRYDKMRDFLMLLDNMNSKIIWKMSPSFQAQFSIRFLPEELSRMR